jgi:hypothetical protein
MAFPLELLKSGIGLADTFTKGVQAAISLEQWTGQSAFGDPTYATAVSVLAIIDMTRKDKRRADGTLQAVVATLTILVPVADNGATGRLEPIDPRDRITLPDGTTGPILGAPNAVLDPSTNRTLFIEVMIGMPNTN